jgi:glutaredoxin
MTKIIVAISLLVTSLIFVVIMVLGGQKADETLLVEKNVIDNSIVENSEEKPEEDIFYWGATCPYCHDVQKWMEEQGVEEKIKITSKEVYNNQANYSELITRAKSCGLNTQRVGVPFFYTIDGNCLVGYPDIIEYLTEKISK